jgi:ribonuclease III
MSDTNSDDEAKIMVNPYNFNNKFVNENFVTSVFKQFGIDYIPEDISLYQNAFIHKSYCKKKLLDLDPGTELVDKPEGALPLQDVDNERLEFLGDSVLSPIVAKYLYERFPDEHEGFMTKMRTRLVNGETLGQFGKELGFGEYLIISRHIEDKCSGRESVKLLEDCFEAFFGAMYLDFNNVSKKSRVYGDFTNVYNTFYSGVGFQVCEQIFINIIEEKIDFAELVLVDINYKERILRYFQNTFKQGVKYTEVNVEEDPIGKTYTMGLLGVDSNVLTIGIARSKKKAEQEAARCALEHFNVL